MVTGDNKATAHHLAARVGISNVMAETLPAGKAEQVSMRCAACCRQARFEHAPRACLRAPIPVPLDPHAPVQALPLAQSPRQAPATAVAAR